MMTGNLGDMQLAATYQKGSGVISVNNLAQILAAMHLVPSRATLYSKGNLALSTTYLVASLSGSSIGLGAVIGGTDRAYSVGDLVDLQASLSDSLGVGKIVAPADGATIPCDLSQGNFFIPAPLGGNRTIVVSNAQVGQSFSIALTQDGTGSRLVTWFGGLKWAGGQPPVLITAAGGIDLFTFKCVNSNVFWGFIAGQGIA